LGIDNYFGIEKSEGLEACKICRKEFKKGEVRLRLLRGETTYFFVYDYYHIHCFYAYNKRIVLKFLKTFLPLVFEEDIAQPLVMSLKLSSSLEET